jgi:hypothetical protein
VEICRSIAPYQYTISWYRPLVGGIESRRQIARAVGCGKSAVSDCLQRARLAGLTAWMQIADLDELETFAPALSQRRRQHAKARTGATASRLGAGARGAGA